MNISKLDHLLSRAVEKLASTVPDYRLDVVATPGLPSDGEALSRLIRERFDAAASPTEDGQVHLCVPVSKVRDLAGSSLVGGLRLARVQRMH
jgi:hypothetical protein